MNLLLLILFAIQAWAVTPPYVIREVESPRDVQSITDNDRVLASQIDDVDLRDGGTIEGTLTVTTIKFSGDSTTQTSTTTVIICPSGFTKIAGGSGRVLGCMQTDEEGTGFWDDAVDDCWDTYGGGLPTLQQGFIARRNYALTNETDDNEWYSDASATAVNQRVYFYQADGQDYSTGGLTNDTSMAYRCWIPAASMIAQ
ncbi:MAG: hypothetical protein ABIH23_27650 [bacterium]